MNRRPKTVMATPIFKRIIGGLTAECREVTPLISRDVDGELTALERFKIRVHFFICDGCRRYSSQIGAMRSVFEKFGERGDGEIRLSEQAKGRMKEALRSTQA